MEEHDPGARILAGVDPDTPFADVVAWLLADPHGVANVTIGASVGEVREAGFASDDHGIDLMYEMRDYRPEGQNLYLFLPNGHVTSMTYEFFPHTKERAYEAHDAFVDTLTAAHGRSRGTKNVTWRYGRTKAVLQTTIAGVGGGTPGMVWRVQVKWSEL